MTPAYFRHQNLDIKASDYVYLDLESPVDYNKGTSPCISALGYTDGRRHVLEYVKFSNKCIVTDVMKDDFNSPPTQVYQAGRRADIALKELEKFANNRPILVFGEFDKKLIELEKKRYGIELELNLIDFKKSINTPTKNYTLSISRLMELLGIEGNFVEHNPLHDARKLKAIHERYVDTPEFRQKAFILYLESELRSLLKTSFSGVTRVSDNAEKYLGLNEEAKDNLKTKFLEELMKGLTQGDTFN